MYWFLSGNTSGGLALLAYFVVLAAAGRGLAGRAFNLAPRERWLVGLALGLTVTVWMANLLGRWVAPGWAFWLPPLAAVAAGWLTVRRAPAQAVERAEVGPWPFWILLVAVAVLIALIGRGLAVFDDRKNLSLISTMAAGDIPPHFYMNAGLMFPYHYGFQLVGALLMRIGGLFPWSAFDLAKGLMGSLALGLAALWGRRATGLWWAGIGLAGFLALVSGTRWLLLLLPPQVLAGVSAPVELWGSASQSAPSLAEGLRSAWVLEGGPPVAVPFAFVNGILQPYVLQMQAGPKSLGWMLLFLFLLLHGRVRGTAGWVLLTILLSVWALSAEAEFVLLAFGVLVAYAFLRGRFRRPDALGIPGVFLASALVAVLQGGTLTEAARHALLPASESASEAGSLAGFSWRPEPAIVSSHLGELRVREPASWPVAASEVGPVLLLAPVVIGLSIRWIRRGQVVPLGYAVSTFVGFLLPVFVRYEVDRDITRITQHALLGWIVLSVALVPVWIRRQRGQRWLGAVVLLGGSAALGGVVAWGSLLTALARPILSTEIAPVDAAMARELWNRLPPHATVLDSHAWRSVAVTGRLTRSAADSGTQLPAWEALVAAPSAERVAARGFDFVYVDSFWWNSMGDEARTSYLRDCARLVAEMQDGGLNGSRRLFDVRPCRTESGSAP
jgi:hypothetical protein